MKIMVSACLLGKNCKYNGKNNRNDSLLALLQNHTVIPICPEVLGGLPTPRTPAELVSGRVCTKDGRDVDEAFRRGAALALQMALAEGADCVVLQSRSPSCGVKEIYDGSFSGTKIPGEGVFASLCRKAGIPTYDVEDFLSSGFFPTV